MAQKTLAVLGGLLLTAVATVLFLPSSTGEESLGEWKPGEEVEIAAQDTGDPEAAQVENPGAAGLERQAVAMDATGDANEPRTEVLLRGRVVNRTGGPVANAQVQLDFSRGGQRGGRPGGDRQRRIPDPVKTDAEGRFAFKGQMFRSLRVSLAVQHPDYAPARHDKDLGEAAAEMDVGDLKVLAGGTIVGRVTDLAGTAVPGAELRLSSEGRDLQALLGMMGGGRGGRGGGGNAEPQSKSDNNGFFRISHVNAGEWRITARATKHTDTRSPAIVVEDEKEVTIEDLRMGPGFVLTGIVSNAQSKPVQGAEVILRERRGGRDHRTNTDAKGTFSLDHLPGSELDLTVRAKDMLTHEQRGIDPSKTPGPLYITLQDGLRITGIAMDAPTSQPVTKYAVQAQRVRDLPRPVDPNDPRSRMESLFRDMQGQMNTPEGRTQMRERFQQEMERMRAEGVDMSQMGDMRGMMGDFFRGGQGGGDAGNQGGRGGRGGNDAGGNNNDQGGGRRGRGGQGQNQQLQIDLGGGNGGAITMNVEGMAQGVEAFFNGGRGNLGKPEDHPEGKFELTGLQEGVYVVVVQSPEHTRFRSAEIELRQGAAPFVNANLERGFHVTGIVKDTDGNPLAGALVELRTADTNNNPMAGMNFGNFGQEAERMGRMMRRFAPQGTRVAEARTSPDGKFTIEHAPRGLYRLSSSLEGYDVASTEPFELAQDLADSALLLGKLGVLTGKVLGYVKTEKTVSVVAIPTGEQTMRLRENQPITQVQPDGTYRLENLAPGSFAVRASSGGMGELMREIGPQMMSGQLGADVVVRGGEVVEFDVALADLTKGTVTGIVTDNGTPARGMSVSVMPADTGGGNAQMFQRMARTYGGQTDAEGKYTIENVPEGNYELRVTATRGGGGGGRGGMGGFGGFGGSQLLTQSIYVAARVDNTFNVAVSTCSVEGAVTMPAGEEPAALNGSVSLLPGATEVPADFNPGRGGRGGFGGFGGAGGGGGANAINGRIENNKFTFEQIPSGSYLLVLSARGRDRVTQQVVFGSGPNRVEVAAGKPSAPAQPKEGPPAAPQPNQPQGQQPQPAGTGGGR